MMSAIKANGILKQFLCNARYEESLARIRSVAHHQHQVARDELMRCRRDHFKVGEQVRSSIKLAKISVITLGFVEKDLRSRAEIPDETWISILIYWTRENLYR